MGPFNNFAQEKTEGSSRSTRARKSKERSKIGKGGPSSRCYLIKTLKKKIERLGKKTKVDREINGGQGSTPGGELGAHIQWGMGEKEWELSQKRREKDGLKRRKLTHHEKRFVGESDAPSVWNLICAADIRIERSWEKSALTTGGCNKEEIVKNITT